MKQLGLFLKNYHSRGLAHAFLLGHRGAAAERSDNVPCWDGELRGARPGREFGWLGRNPTGRRTDGDTLTDQERPTIICMS